MRKDGVFETHREVLEALVQGKKIHGELWRDGCLVYLGSDGFLKWEFYDICSDITFSDLFKEETWGRGAFLHAGNTGYLKEYIPPKELINFSQVPEYLEKGYWLKPDTDVDFNYVKFSNSGKYGAWTECREGKNPRIYKFEPIHVKCKWIVVKQPED